MSIESVATPAPQAALNGKSDYLNAPNSKPEQAVGKAKGGEGMRRALEVYKEKFPLVEAILVGTRRGDPHGGTLPCCLFALRDFDTQCSDFELSEPDRRRLAALRARAPDHQLVVRGCVDIPPQT